MPRHKNTSWDCTTNGIVTNADARLAVLMDIRDELQTLNGLLTCPNFIAIPHKLDAIRKNTTKKRRRK